jgi:hypothetical protein
MINQLLKDFKGLVVDAGPYLEKQIKLVLNKKWEVGYNDRGHGHGDFAVVATYKGKTIVIVECPHKTIAEHIVETHNKGKK